jgi:hypothetical protein
LCGLVKTKKKKIKKKKRERKKGEKGGKKKKNLTKYYNKLSNIFIVTNFSKTFILK